MHVLDVIVAETDAQALDADRLALVRQHDPRNAPLPFADTKDDALDPAVEPLGGQGFKVATRWTARFQWRRWQCADVLAVHDDLRLGDLDPALADLDVELAFVEQMNFAKVAALTA